MYLHVGDDVTVCVKDISGIYDYALFESDFPFLNNVDRQSKQLVVTAAAAEKPKSLVVTDKVVYLSAISSSTLAKRANTSIKQGEYFNESRK